MLKKPAGELVHYMVGYILMAENIFDYLLFQFVCHASGRLLYYLFVSSAGFCVSVYDSEYEPAVNVTEPFLTAPVLFSWNESTTSWIPTPPDDGDTVIHASLDTAVQSEVAAMVTARVPACPGSFLDASGFVMTATLSGV